MGKTYLTSYCVSVLILAASARAQQFERLFDGKTLKGWHATGKGTWTVGDSALKGVMAPGNPESYLISDVGAKDFTYRLKVLWTTGNSGANFRNVQKGDLSEGIQADVDGAAGSTGWLYDNVKAAYVAKNDTSAKWYKADDWNDLVVTADGPSITVSLNGRQTVAYQDNGGNAEGVFAFQLHVGIAMEVEFKDIELWDHAKTTVISRLPPPRRPPGMALFSFAADGRRLPSLPEGSREAGSRRFRSAGTARDGDQ